DVRDGTEARSLVTGYTCRAGCPEHHVLGTEAQIVVFELGHPVIGEGIFQADPNQQTVQSGVTPRGAAKVAAEIHLRRVPVKSAGNPPCLAVNKGTVQRDTDPGGDVVVPFVPDAGGPEQRVSTALVYRDLHA